ncbi:hypothetical protein GCM10009560_53720 [Nonomuraea longicatena]|uniref:Uncharacterized protein n=1 Tax=Nonomuraea longicatena TaxID=83682 RepID=A0ABP4AYU1_9ACTN
MVEGVADELADAVRGGEARVAPVARHQPQPRRGGHLHHRGAVAEQGEVGGDGLADRTGRRVRHQPPARGLRQRGRGTLPAVD